MVIRDNLTGDDLVSISIDPNRFTNKNFTWVEFDIDDIPVKIGKTYYIICYSENVTGAPCTGVLHIEIGHSKIVGGHRTYVLLTRFVHFAVHYLIKVHNFGSKGPIEPYFNVHVVPNLKTLHVVCL